MVYDLATLVFEDKSSKSYRVANDEELDLVHALKRTVSPDLTAVIEEVFSVRCALYETVTAWRDFHHVVLIASETCHGTEHAVRF